MIINLTIPKNVNLLLKKGENVNFQTPFYQINLTQEKTINVAEKLGINKNKIFQYLKIAVGQKVYKNEVLALKKGFFSEKKIIAPMDSLIKEINHETGSITLLHQSEKNKIHKCFFNGLVKEIKNDKITIQLKEAIAYPLKQCQKESGGEVFYFKSENLFFEINEEKINNKIIIVENLKPFISIKCEALGARGFIFLKGEPQTELPFAIIKKIDDFNKINNENRPFCLFSQNDQKVVFYH